MTCTIFSSATQQQALPVNLNFDIVSCPARGRAEFGEISMLDHCANPNCAKPLRYLREGRIFVFDSLSSGPDGNAKRAHRLEHFWLCGTCSKTFLLEKTQQGIRLEHKAEHSIPFIHAQAS
jgi:hypothetical protein